MRKAFILPSLEVKKFNRESILTTSTMNSNVADAQTALDNVNIKMESVAVRALKN